MQWARWPGRRERGRGLGPRQYGLHGKGGETREEVDGAKHILGDVDRFSRLVTGVALYGYQSQAVRPILDSIVGRQGLEFLLVFPRQSGKNEAVAQLLVLLLNLFQRSGGNIVYGAIGDGLGRGVRRLEERLDNPWNKGLWQRGIKPVRRRLGKAAVVFLSSHPQAFARGETANRLLVIDELQDQDASHMEAVFEPMRAANNATAVYIGTVKTTTDALWRKKQELEREQNEDGKRRVFIVEPDMVVADNPHYGSFLQGKVEKLGRKHPIVASEYFNEPVDGSGGLFDARRLALMEGRHGRRSLEVGDRHSGSSHTVVATLDIAGQDEAATDPVAQLKNPGRDYTVAHVFELDTEGKLPDLPGGGCVCGPWKPPFSGRAGAAEPGGTAAGLAGGMGDTAPGGG